MGPIKISKSEIDTRTFTENFRIFGIFEKFARYRISKFERISIGFILRYCEIPIKTTTL